MPLTNLQSDHSVINSRYLLHEAAQAHYFGLPTNVALLSITATPADAMGLGHRIGRIEEGIYFSRCLFGYDIHRHQQAMMQVGANTSRGAKGSRNVQILLYGIRIL